MGEVVNLNRYRKSRERQDLELRAAENRARSGRTKDERRREKAKEDHKQAEFDGKKLEKAWFSGALETTRARRPAFACRGARSRQVFPVRPL